MVIEEGARVIQTTVGWLYATELLLLAPRAEDWRQSFGGGLVSIEKALLRPTSMLYSEMRASSSQYVPL